MQIVIDIPKNIYENMAKIANSGKEPLGYFERVIMHGTPLPTAHWTKCEEDSRGYSDTYECDKCGNVIQYAYYTRNCDYEYCPNCGAEMEENNDTQTD